MFGLKKELAEVVERKITQFHKVLKNCLKIKKENILIISDYGENDRRLSAMLAYGYYLAAKSKNLSVDLLFQNITY